MCARAPRRVCVLVFLVVITSVVVVAVPDTPSSWVRSQQPQTLHGLMISIDERLHTLENARWEATLKQVDQRLDTLESTIRRLDSAFQDRLDKLERNLNSKELKDELSVEKLSHKLRDILDSSYDRYSRRLGYTEERLELSLKKVQMGVEGSLNRVEKQQEDTQSDVSEAITLLQDLQVSSSTTHDKLNSTHKVIQQHIQKVMSPSQEELQRISGSLEHLGSRLNSSLGMWGSQNDGPQVNDVLAAIPKQINLEANKFTNKVNNMYNDLWRRMVSVESLLKDVSRVSNTTGREMMEEVRSLVLTDRRDFPGDSQENFMEVAMDAMERKLQRKLQDLSRKLDDRLDTMSATQNLVMDSCFDGSICRGLESRLSQVLERIFDIFSSKIETYSNRTLDLDSLVLEMMELAKTQHSQLIRTVTHNTNMVVTLAKDSSDANKLLHNTLTQLAEKTEFNLQELQYDIQEITNTSEKVCGESEKNHEENFNSYKIVEVHPQNITEIQLISVNFTQPTKNETKKQHDNGVLKITTDMDVLGDNATLANPGSIKLHFNSTPDVDNSFMGVIGMISPNLTDNQLESFLRFLNTSVNLDNLEAIIQNTEAEPEDESTLDGASLEVYDADIEPMNKTNSNDVNTLANNSTKDLLSSESSDEMENVFEETAEDPDQIEMSEMIRQNLTDVVGTQIEKNQLEQKLSGMPKELEDQIKLYALLLKMKQGEFNMTALLADIRKTSNHREEHVQSKLIAVLQKLCYGESIKDGLTPDYSNNFMRNRLLLINQTLNDVKLYEKIENICNTMIESLHGSDENDRFNSDR